ncbi:MAG: hypothetical protein WBV59_16525, partial [Anaerolineae bacterium]
MRQDVTPLAAVMAPALPSVELVLVGPALPSVEPVLVGPALSLVEPASLRAAPVWPSGRCTRPGALSARESREHMSDGWVTCYFL